MRRSVPYGIAARLATCFGAVAVFSLEQQQPLTPPGRHLPPRAQNPFTEDFAHFVKKALHDWHVAGIAISVVDGNDTFAEVNDPHTNPPPPTFLLADGETLRVSDSRPCQQCPQHPKHSGTWDRRQRLTRRQQWRP